MTRAKQYLKQGLELLQTGQIALAIAALNQAFALDPNDAAIPKTLGIAFQEQGQLTAAAHHYSLALELNPDDGSVYSHLGEVLQATGRVEEAIACYQCALDLNPTHLEAHINLGVLFQQWGKSEQAIRHARGALTLQPNSAVAHSNLGVALMDQGQVEAAIHHYRLALSFQPHYPEARNNLGLALLLQGQFPAGFAEHEWRTHCKPFKSLPFPPSARPWDGSPLVGEPILLCSEGGFGDTLQFVRYAPLVADRGGQVILHCQPELLPLLTTVPGVSQGVAVGEPLPPYEVYAWLLSLPHLFRTTLETVPAQIPYIKPPHRSSPLPCPPQARLKVGIAWASGIKVGTMARSYRDRSLPLDLLLPHLSRPDIALYSLQVGPHAQDLAPFTDRIQDLSPQLQDFGDTAAAIAQLDLVITVDTAVAHLAGALGQPTWVLLPFAPDWRWRLHRPDSPWYPTLRLFRQPTPGNWPAVLHRVAQALQTI